MPIRACLFMRLFRLEGGFLFPSYFMGGQVSDIYSGIRKARLRSFSSYIIQKRNYLYPLATSSPPLLQFRPGVHVL